MSRVDHGRTGPRWWATVVLVVAGSVAAAALIVFGAVRFLDAADRQQQRVECLRTGLADQARSNASMATAVLDMRRTQAERTASVAAWRGEQADLAVRIGRC